MSYITNNTRLSSLTIAGVDYTTKLVSWTASDSSANKNGCIKTTGSLVIGQKIGAQSLDDYERDSFRRGDEVILKITTPGGGEQIHPRGRLYVVSSVYEAETERLRVEIGCRLVLISLMGKSDDSQLDELRSLVPLELDTAQGSFNNCCAGFASVGQYVFQNNTGALEVNTFWDGDGFGSTAPGEWLSVLGLTTNSVKPLAGSGAIPDEIKLSYQVASDEIATDNKGRTDVVETDSYYFYQYPVVSFTRQNTDATPDNPNGTLDNVGSVTSEAGASAPSSSSCGNTPDPPQGEVQEPSCNEGYILTQTPVYIPAFRRAKQTTTYDGPGAQVSTVLTEEFGPKVEANGQYFADQYAFCRQTWGTACQPNGDCPYYGTDEIQLGYTLQTNYYGTANELVKTVTDTYVTLLSAAQPSDWRAGNVAGEIQNFDDTLGDNTGFYRASRSEQLYSQEENANVQTTNDYVSVTSRGVGISGGQELDAVLGGIQTKTVRTSTTITTLDIQPDILNSATTSTVEKTEDIILFTNRFTRPPSESGPYILEEQIPQPLLFEDESEIEFAVATYSNYLVRFIKGDALGLQIGEGLSNEVISNWRPGMPFRYYDQDNDVLLAMRMDACAWGVSNEECSFVTDALWNGVSNGNPVLPDNIVGNSQPDMSVPPSGVGGGSSGGGSGGSPTPPSPPVGGDVIDEDNVDSGPLIFSVDVFFTFSSIANTYSVDGVGPLQPEPGDVIANWTSTCYVEGLIVGSGDLLATELNGSIPADYLGSLVTVDATVVNADLFAQTP